MSARPTWQDEYFEAKNAVLRAEETARGEASWSGAAGDSGLQQAAEELRRAKSAFGPPPTDDMLKRAALATYAAYRNAPELTDAQRMLFEHPNQNERWLLIWKRLACAAIESAGWP
jgi:hypothetical protein